MIMQQNYKTFHWSFAKAVRIKIHISSCYLVHDLKFWWLLGELTTLNINFTE